MVNTATLTDSADAAVLNALDERISLGGRRFGADQRGFTAVRQQAVDLAGVLDGSGEDHLPHKSSAPATIWLMIYVTRLPFSGSGPLRRTGRCSGASLPVVLHDRHIQPYQKNRVCHVAQRQLIDAVAKQTGCRRG